MTTAKPLQLIPQEDLQTIQQEIREIKNILQNPAHPEDIFRRKWIESKRVPPLLGISPRTWQAWRDQRVIPYSQFGSKIYVKLEDLNTLLESKKIEALKTA